METTCHPVVLFLWKGSSGPLILWGGFCWQSLGLLAPLKGRFVAIQYKNVLTDLDQLLTNVTDIYSSDTVQWNMCM
uniref:Uncharacterized protein n=1 Tax=Mastacembelus armatus TaxID=205130 RepID=A0A7N8YNN5_9TELE